MLTALQVFSRCMPGEVHARKTLVGSGVYFSVLQVQHAQLLAQLYVKRGDYGAAASVLYALATRRSGAGDTEVSLLQRLDHLRAATLQARFCKNDLPCILAVVRAAAAAADAAAAAVSCRQGAVGVCQYSVRIGMHAVYAGAMQMIGCDAGQKRGGCRQQRGIGGGRELPGASNGDCRRPARVASGELRSQTGHSGGVSCLRMADYETAETCP